MQQYKYDISVVLGSKNRNGLLKATIKSIRNNGFPGKMEIIVIDGGSTDGTCNWLARQKDITTIIQMNYKTIDAEGVSILAHSWGEFMNIGFKHANSPWILMVSDDLILSKGSIANGYNELSRRIRSGEKLGGGAFYFREYPRNKFYRVNILPKNLININHGFYYKPALEDVSYAEEHRYNFYCADGDIVMRMDKKGWQTIALESTYANHLSHLPALGRKKLSASTARDIETFNSSYPHPCSTDKIKKYLANDESRLASFWIFGFKNCLVGLMLRIYDYKKKHGASIFKH